MTARKRILLAIWSLCVLGFIPIDSVQAQPVTVTAVAPSSAYQGTASLDVVVRGSGFDRTAKVKYLVSGTTDPGGVTVLRVVYRSSSELVTTIGVASNANLAKFDVEVTLDTGRRGKGTTLFKVEMVPIYPQDRAWHTFTSNREAGATTSQLYLYGGGGDDWQAVPADLWSYSAYAHGWARIVPTGTSKPGARQHHAFSCGRGKCLLAAGNNGVGLVGNSGTDQTTWLFDETTKAWAQVACRKSGTCLSARQMATTAFDPDRGTHLLFGGLASYSSPGLNDTLTFDPATLKWTAWSPAFKPSERNRAAALHVPGIGIVMHGGQPRNAMQALCDMYAWNGSNWRRIGYDSAQPYPCLHSHSLAWDGSSLVVGAGYGDTSDTPNPTHWRFTFASNGLSGTWTQISSGTCRSTSGADVEIHPGARMAYDVAAKARVYFGGEVNTDAGAVRFGNTVECY